MHERQEEVMFSAATKPIVRSATLAAISCCLTWYLYWSDRAEIAETYWVVKVKLVHPFCSFVGTTTSGQGGRLLMYIQPERNLCVDGTRK